MPVNSMLVEVGRYGRLVLPKTLREKYGVDEGSKLIISGVDDRIELLPVKTYENPAEEPLDHPKEVARSHGRDRASRELE
jgi:AbrB family looped-hinge helix DNA binding protein